MQTQSVPQDRAVVEPILRRVTLSDAGIGQFDFSAEVSGDSSVLLKADSDELDDILKSLTVSDPTGEVTSVSVPCTSSVRGVFCGSYLDRSRFVSIKQLFEALRGAEIVVTGPSSVAGQIVAVGTIPLGGSNPSLDSRYSDGEIASELTLDVMTDAGLVAVPLAPVTSIEFANPRLKSAFDAYLSSIGGLGSGHVRDLRITFRGGDNRTVEFSYVTASPVWKVSYRLLLQDDTAKLQGWASVENRSSRDWFDVKLVLTAFKPMMIAVDRETPNILSQSEIDSLLSATEAPQVPAAEAPLRTFADLEQLDSTSIQSILRNIDNEKLVKALSGASETLWDLIFSNMSERAAAMIRQDVRSSETTLRQADIDAAQMDVMKVVKDMAVCGEIVLPDPVPGPEIQHMAIDDLLESVPDFHRAKDEGGETSEPAKIRFDKDVHVPAASVAALPFVELQIPLRRMAICWASVFERHPLTAIQLTNPTSTDLPSALVSIYESDSELGTSMFLGEAVIPQVQAHGSGHVEFGQDQTISIEREIRQVRRRDQVEIVDGKLHELIVELETVCYHVHSSAADQRDIIIEHPVRHGWTIIEPRSLVCNGDHYRLEFELPVGELHDVVVVQQITHTKVFEVSSLDEDELSGYANAAELTRQQREFFSELVALTRERRRLEERSRQLRYEHDDARADLETTHENIGNNSSWRMRRRDGEKLATQDDNLAKISSRRRAVYERLREIEDTFTNKLDGGIPQVDGS